MTLKPTNSFDFLNPGQASGITVLNAVMADFSYAKHTHEELAIGVTTAGIQEFSCNGRSFRSLPGDIILFNPDEAHNGNPGAGNVLKYSMLYFDPAKLYPLIACASNEITTQCRIPEIHFRDPLLRAKLLDITHHARTFTTSALEQELELYAVARLLAKRLGSFQPAAWTDRKDALLMTVRDYIHDNIAEEISIDDLSQVVNVSKYHLIRIFRRHFGLTPHQYILNHRINKVREALQHGMSATWVAHEFGFFDTSHLNRHFKRSYGITPKQYQRQIQKRGPTNA